MTPAILMRDPFNPKSFPQAPKHPGLRGFGDVVALIAQPIAGGIDRVLGTNIKNCQGCQGRQAKLNRLLPFNTLRPFREIEPQHDTAIVYPWLASAAVWDELRYSLRSVHAHFEDRDCQIYIIGPEAPAWLEPDGRVRFICVPEMKDKEAEMHEVHIQGMQVARKLLWWNDDIYLLRKTGWGDFAVALTEGEIGHRGAELRHSGNVFKQGLGDAVVDLKSLGDETVWRFATHTPYLFEIEKSRQILERFPLRYKGSWETLYFNYHHTPHAPCGANKTKSLPAHRGERFLNHRHGGPNPETRALLERMFPNPAPWEKNVDMQSDILTVGGEP
jgi:hypothetical protein